MKISKITSLASMIAALTFTSCAVAQNKSADTEAAQPKPIWTVTEDSNEFGAKLKINDIVDNGISYVEREKAGKLGTPDNKESVMSDFRLKDGNVYFKVNVGQTVKDMKMSEQDFKAYANAVIAANTPAAPAETATPAVSATGVPAATPTVDVSKTGVASPSATGIATATPAVSATGVATVDVSKTDVASPSATAVLTPIAGTNGLDYILETIAGKESIYVKFPGKVGIEIDPAEQKQYTLSVLKGDDLSARVLVKQEKDKADVYALVAAAKDGKTAEAELSLAKVKEIYAHISAKDAFNAANKDNLVLDNKTGEYVLRANVDAVLKASQLKDDANAQGYSRTVAEWKELLADSKVSASDRRYGTRVLDELMSSFQPKTGWIFEQEGKQVQGPRTYAALAAYVAKKNPEIKTEDMQKAIDALTYTVSFVPGGRPEFQIVVKDGEATVGVYKTAIENASRFGGNAESRLKNALKSAGYTD
jgi:hypothetical protein